MATHSNVKVPDEETLRRLQSATKQPLNRQQRKRLAKEAGLSLQDLNQFAVRRAPAYMGIKQFKKLRGGKLPNGAKEAAWSALHKHNDKLRAERLQREGKAPELSGRKSGGTKKKRFWQKKNKP